MMQTKYDFLRVRFKQILHPALRLLVLLTKDKTPLLSYYNAEPPSCWWLVVHFTATCWLKKSFFFVPNSLSLSVDGATWKTLVLKHMCMDYFHSLRNRKSEETNIDRRVSLVLTHPCLPTPMRISKCIRPVCGGFVLSRIQLEFSRKSLWLIAPELCIVDLFPRGLSDRFIFEIWRRMKYVHSWWPHSYLRASTIDNNPPAFFN